MRSATSVILPAAAAISATPLALGMKLFSLPLISWTRSTSDGKGNVVRVSRSTLVTPDGQRVDSPHYVSVSGPAAAAIQQARAQRQAAISDDENTMEQPTLVNQLAMRMDGDRTDDDYETADDRTADESEEEEDSPSLADELSSRHLVRMPTSSDYSSEYGRPAGRWVRVMTTDDNNTRDKRTDRTSDAPTTDDEEEEEATGASDEKPSACDVDCSQLMRMLARGCQQARSCQQVMNCPQESASPMRRLRALSQVMSSDDN